MKNLIVTLLLALSFMSVPSLSIAARDNLDIQNGTTNSERNYLKDIKTGGGDVGGTGCDSDCGAGKREQRELLERLGVGNQNSKQ